MPDRWASASWIGASHSASMAGSLARVSVVDRKYFGVVDRNGLSSIDFGMA
jgi:hypothetical protein